MTRNDEESLENHEDDKSHHGSCPTLRGSGSSSDCNTTKEGSHPSYYLMVRGIEYATTHDP
jgi:hypothetical protein